MQIFAIAIAGGFAGLMAVMMLYAPDDASEAPVSHRGAALLTAAPMPFAPGRRPASREAAGRTARMDSMTADKSDMVLPLMTRLESAPTVLQASWTVEEPLSGSTEIMKSPPPEPVDKTFRLERGDQLAEKLVELGVGATLAQAAAAEIDRIYPLKKIPRGQKIVVTLDRLQDFYGREVTYPVYVAFSPAKGQRVVAEVDDEGRFVARIERSRRKGVGLAAAPYRHVKGRITSSLYAAARDLGVPDYIVAQMLRALSHQVDLQRQVHKGDTFEILYGKPFSGSSSRRYVLHYAALNLHGRKIAFYRFTPPDGKTAYFDRDGQSIRRSLMRTPISGARISSGFGMRRHPILGYTKMHTGVDFAAGRGTPIHAAGSGLVIHAGWRGGYGRTVMIRHDNGYVTLYAHQSRIARGIRKGVRVRQGQVIGYVGSSGRATGPHLHYEVRINGKPVNPLRVRTANRVRLKGKALAALRKQIDRIEALLKRVPAGAQIARK